MLQADSVSANIVELKNEQASGCHFNFRKQSTDEWTQQRLPTPSLEIPQSSAALITSNVGPK
jgi:hypothetical protein